MKSNAQILREILATAQTSLLNDSDMGYTMPDGKHHIYIYADQETHWDDRPADKFYVVEPNKVVNGAHEPMGDTFITTGLNLSEVLIGCQWCMDWFENDRAQEVSRKDALPDELIVRLAHEAGWLESEGKIALHSWEDLQIAIRDAMQEYYKQSNEYNPFTIEETIEWILKERFPSEPEPLKSQYKELCILSCTAEHDYGINSYASLHPNSKEALKQADAIRKTEEVDEMYWNYDIDFQVVDVSLFPDASPERIAAHVMQQSENAKEKCSLEDQIRAAEHKRISRENAQTVGIDHSSQERQ